MKMKTFPSISLIGAIFCLFMAAREVYQYEMRPDKDSGWTLFIHEFTLIDIWSCGTRQYSIDRRVWAAREYLKSSERDEYKDFYWYCLRDQANKVIESRGMINFNAKDEKSI